VTDLFHPNLAPMAVGSLPYADPVEATNKILQYLPEIPAWPQLPNRTFLENMYAQYSEGFPGVIIHDERIYVDRERDLDPELEQLYTDYLSNDLEAGALSADYAAGLAHFLTLEFDSARAVKGQVTGPISWGLTVTDQALRPVLYDEVLADAVAKHLRLKAAWQERELRKRAPHTIMFVDEPYMASFGSAYIAIEREQVIALLEEVFSGIQGIKGVHCCGNTDWSILLSTSVDILNLDAYGYAETLSLYPEAVRAFLDRGGIIAWGIVPVHDEAHLMGETAANLTDRLQEAIKLVASKGVPLDALLASALITPTCGMRTLSEKAAEHALGLLAQVSQQMRAKYPV
jgi:methionine synthase II (cobalamin-independent)